MFQFYQSAFAKALGWALIDSLWQMGLLWLMCLLVTGNGRKGSAAGRFRVALIFLFSGSFLFFLQLALNMDAGDHASWVLAFSSYLGSTLPANAESFAENLMPLLSLAYLVLFTLQIIRFLYPAIKGRPMAPLSNNDFTEILLMVEQVASRFGISKKVALRISDRVFSPFTRGVIRPLIFLPLSIVTHLNKPELETILAHEIFHIRRNDFLTNTFLIICDTIFFFNPFARILINTCKKEREHACDDLVLAAGYERRIYAQALLQLGKYSAGRHFYPMAAIAATGHSSHLLLQRINRIFQRKPVRDNVVRPAGLFLVWVGLTLICLSVPSAEKENAVSANAAGTTYRFATLEKQATETAHVQPFPTAVFTMDKAAAKESTRTVKSPVKALSGLKAKPRSPRSEQAVPVMAEPLPEPPVPPSPPTILYIKKSVKVPEFTIRFSTSDNQKQPASVLSKPYVPSSSFYYPDYSDTDSGKSKRIIHL